MPPRALRDLRGGLVADLDQYLGRRPTGPKNSPRRSCLAQAPAIYHNDQFAAAAGLLWGALIIR